MGGFFMFLILLVVGVINLLSPETAWNMSEGWKFKDAELSEHALLWSRIVGVICLIAAVVILIKM